MGGASWTPVSEPVQGTEFRFAVHGDRIAVVSESTVFMFSASANSPPASIALRIKTSRGDLPSAMLLVDDALFLAYDIGEFGGGLFRMDLKRPDKAPTRLIASNVQALARTKSGVIWAAGSLSHLGSVSAALYRISGNRLEVVAAISGFENGPQGDKITKRAGVPFPRLTSLGGFSLGKEERPTVILPRLGVFELAGDRFVRLFEGALSFHYQTPTYAGGSHPVGLAMGKSGEIYVASRTLGIFVLRKENNQYKLKQLLFEDPARDKPLNPAR
jgi:hypothetical protein